MITTMEHMLFLTMTNGFGGAEVHLLELLKRINYDKYRVSIVCFKKDPYTSLLTTNQLSSVRVISCQRPSNYFGFLKLLLNTKPKILVFVKGCFNIYPWWTYIAAFSYGLRKIYAIEHLADQPVSSMVLSHGRIKQLYKKTIGWAGRQKAKILIQNLVVKKTICVSDVIRKNLVNNLCFSPTKVVTVYNGVDLDYFSKNPDLSIRDKYNIGAFRKVLICVARLSKEKGIKDLLEALLLLKHDNLKVKLFIVGDGSLKEEISTYIRILNLVEDVNLVGFHNDIRPFLKASDIFVLPSYIEGLPFTLLEAMACGLPCVATNVGGNSEAVVDKETGYLVNPRDRHGLSKAIKELLVDDAKRKIFGDNGKKRVGHLFQIDQTMGAIKAILCQN